MISSLNEKQKDYVEKLAHRLAQNYFNGIYK